MAHRSGPLPATRSAVLVIPESSLRDLLALHLRAAGCFPLPVATAAEGRRLATQLVPDLLLIDIDDVPDADCDWALALARRETGPAVPLAWLTSTPQQCQAGACTNGWCIAKPVEPRALTAQLMRLMTGQGPVAAEPARLRPRPPLRTGPVELERDAPTVRIRRGERWLTLDLPATEHRLLGFLLQPPGRMRSREEIRQTVWHGADVDLRTVDQYVRRLRRSLEAAEARDWIKTINRAGYRLQFDDPTDGARM